MAAPYLPPPAYSPYPQQQPSGGSQMPSSQVELHISCRNLIDMDTFSKSDPIVVVYVLAQNKRDWREYGRSEIIWNNLNPDFAKSFVMDYFFEEVQKLKFEIYDVDADTSDLSKHDFLGSMECNLGLIFGEHNGRLETPLKNPQHSNAGKIIISAEEVSSSRDVITLQFCGKKLDRKDFFGKSDPFLAISRCNEDNSYTVVHRTEEKKSTLNPTWLPFTISARVLCNGDYDRTLLFECFDWNRNGSHSLIGAFQTSLRDLIGFKSGRPSSYDAINPNKKRKKKSYRNSGIIHVIDCKVTQKPTFLDFVGRGTELNVVVAVDFTASNGAPSTPSSLHYLNPHRPNQYIEALTAVGQVIEDYDSDKLFPAFGFGAKVPPAFNVSHEFPLNANAMNPMCQGIDGIIAAYYQSLHQVTLYGPTNFAPVINSTARIAAEHSHGDAGSQYFILLILTDGIITDMERTKEAIVRAASLPMSIIIIGIGKAEFDAMEELDGDVIRLSYRGKEAERDIVQFVPFRDYLGRGGEYDTTSGARLAKDVLQELPSQLLDYMEKRNIQPKMSIPR